MKIITTYYEFWREDNVYYVKNIDSAVYLPYTLYTVKNSVETPLDTPLTLIDPDETVTLNLTDEGSYKIVITHPAEDGIAIISTSYNIRYYANIKSNIIPLMREMICNCLNLDSSVSSCSSTSVSPVTNDLYNVALLYNSVGLYRDLLLSPTFLRDYRTCLMSVLENTNVTLHTLLQATYTELINKGVPSNSIHLLRLYTAYMYILFYVIELDIAEYTTGDNGTTNYTLDELTTVQSTDSDDVAAVKELFLLENMLTCFTALNIDVLSVFNNLNNCYKDNIFGSTTDSSSEDAISDLDHTGYELYVTVGTTVTPTTFTWTETGLSEKNLKLDDNGVGTISDVSVSGGTYSSGAAAYTLAIPSSVVWSLSGDNVKPINLTTNWVYDLYSGINSTGVFPIEAEILAETGYSVNAAEGFTVDVSTLITQYAWFAVPVAATAQYTQWENLDVPSSKSTIGAETSSNFIIVGSSTVSVAGISYYVYMFKWNTKFTNTLKLY